MNGPSDPQQPAPTWAPPSEPPSAPQAGQPYQQPYQQSYPQPYAVPSGGQSWPSPGQPTGRPTGPGRVHVLAGVVGLVALALELWGDWDAVHFLGYIVRGEYPAPYAASVLLGFASTFLFAAGTVAAFVPTRSARPPAVLLGLGVGALVLSYVVAFGVAVFYGDGSVRATLLGFVGYTVDFGWYWAGVLSSLSSVVWVLTLPALWLDVRRVSRSAGAAPAVAA